jgi:hypothetical protein
MLSAAFPKTTSYWLPRSTLFYDEAQKEFPKANLPGYHGKGLYSGQGKLVYANNDKYGQAARNNPFTLLAQWDGNKKTLRLSFAACSPQRPVMDPQTVSRIKRDCLRAPAIILAPIYVEADALATVCLIPE